MHKPPNDDKTRESLLERLKNSHDDESWRDFFETYWKLIYHSAVKAGLTDPEAQDVVQETVLSAWKSLPQLQYDGAGSFKGWLLQLTSWRIRDYVRNRQREAQPLLQVEAETGTGTGPIERVPDPKGLPLEAAWDEEFELNLLEVAIERVKVKVDPKDYQIFDLYMIKEWPAIKVAETLGVSRGRVYLAKHRVGGLIKKSLKKLRRSPVHRKLAQKT